MDYSNYSPYFTIGDAVAGLGIFLLIPQFLKPVYIFRLRVLGLGLRTLYATAALGFICVFVGSFAAHDPELFPAFLRAPPLWETVAGILYATSYTALGLVYIFPARVGLDSITKYVRAGAHLLASGTEEDSVEFAADVLANIKKLIKIADLPGAQVPAFTAIMLGLYRRTAAQAAADSESFLRLLADPEFCRTLVSRLPWDAARILHAFSTERPRAQVGRSFVHQLTRQTLLAAETSGTKEDDWRGFSDAPALSQAAFGDGYLNRHYLPWEGLAPGDLTQVDVGLMERVSRAAELTIDEYVAERFSYQSYNIARLQESFEALSRRIYVLKKADADVSPYASHLGRTVKYIVQATRSFCRAATPQECRALYAQFDVTIGFSALNSISEMLISVLENTSYEFSGYDDKFWPMAREIWDSVLPRFGAEPAGMDPLQQRFVMKLIEKTKETLEGFYSPLSRQALAIIGPYAGKGETSERTAFKICRDLFYREFQAFPAFYERDPERAKSFLPANVRYEPETAELVHRFSFGGEDRTKLSTLTIPDVSLATEAIDLGSQTAPLAVRASSG